MTLRADKRKENNKKNQSKKRPSENCPYLSKLPWLIESIQSNTESNTDPFKAGVLSSGHLLIAEQRDRTKQALNLSLR